MADSDTVIPGGLGGKLPGNGTMKQGGWVGIDKLKWGGDKGWYLTFLNFF